eukprot:COSAG01_NODE_229_length_21089_cov_575.019194_19_plen_48_part_00
MPQSASPRTMVQLCTAEHEEYQAMALVMRNSVTQDQSKTAHICTAVP